MPAEILLMKRPRFILDLVYHALDNRVLSKQTNRYVGVPRCSVASAAVIRILPTKLGPVSFTVGLTDGRVWRRHMVHIRLRIPEESDGDAGRALPTILLE
ncbi:hypothetical protein LSAT2_015714 [Lamellibrachia satsuma]|nr:hypothetical protein LSAT2_015714 [Lamellibrachia satsuma]